MKCLQTVLVLLFCTCAMVAVAQQNPKPVKKETYSRLRIFLDSPNTLEELAELGLAVDHGEKEAGKAFIGEFSSTEIKLIEGKYRYEVLVNDLETFYAARTKADAAAPPAIEQPDLFGCTFVTPANFNTGTFAGYLNLAEVLAELDEMRSLYPNLITVKQSLGNSVEGRPIYYVRISDNADTDENEPEGLYTGMHHAREPMSIMNLIYFMHYILENYATNTEVQEIVDNTELYFIPCLNPDGYEYNRSTNPNGGGMWRKNRRNNGNGTFGVDLNRNYGYQWGYNNSGSSSSSSSDTYRGPSAFSEPETQIVRDFCLAHPFVTALNDHAYGNYLVLPWGYINAVPESTLFNSIGNDLNDCNNYIVGNATTTVGYTANGTSDDWMYGEQTSKEKIYAITPEIGTSADGFWPVASKIIPYCQAMMYTNLRMAYFTRSLSCAAKNIVVTPASNSAEVSWTAGTGSISYTVQYRQIGAPTWISTNTSGTSITLLGLTTCQQYEVQVRSSCSGIDGQFSASTNFSTVGDPLPGSWVGVNVGSTGTFGSECYLSATGTYSAVGGGSLTSTSTDGMRFIYATLNGNGSITAKVNSLTTTNNNKAGVMIRESLASNARAASSLIVRASSAWRSQFIRRTSTGANASITQPNTTTTPPYWVRMERSGNTFTSYRSSNGSSWTQIGSATIAMANTTYIGLAVASGSTTASATASISNVSTTGSVSLSGSDDRAAEIGQPVLADENASKATMEVFPNPGSAQVNIQLQLPKAAVVNLSLVDMLGNTLLRLPAQTVAAGTAFQVLEVPASVPAGVYVVKCTVSGQAPVAVRWVKR
jgi:regulation of enolase protein 1 (concanavalin A-like superfamily)